MCTNRQPGGTKLLAMTVPSPLETDELSLRSAVIAVPNFPEQGIVFRDISPLLADPALMNMTMVGLEALVPERVTKVVGIEARGFIFGSVLADRLNCGFVPIRKPGKLPRATLGREYSLEYGPPARLEVHADAFDAGESVLIVDDVLATGGTAEATAGLIRGAGARLVGAVFVIELEGLPGRSRLDAIDLPTYSLLRF